MEQNIFDEHIRYIGDEGGVSDSDHFDRDDNSISSETEDVEFEA